MAVVEEEVEESIADDDVDDDEVPDDVPNPKRDLKAEAKSLAHLLDHNPKNPYCDSCARGIMKNKRSKTGAFTREYKKWGGSCYR